MAQNGISCCDWREVDSGKDNHWLKMEQVEFFLSRNLKHVFMSLVLMSKFVSVDFTICAPLFVLQFFIIKPVCLAKID